MNATTESDFRRLLVVIPNWVGDVVLASPVFAAMRAQFSKTRITFLMRRYLRDLLQGCNWHDDEIYWPEARGAQRVVRFLDLPARLKSDRFDAALLLTNSFRSALVARLAGIPRRIGYAREARGWMLTQKLYPRREAGAFVPSPVTDYYCALSESVGCRVDDRQLRLGVAPDHEQKYQELLAVHKINKERPYVVVNPGAKFGASKCWLPEYFAEVCDRLVRERQLLPVLVGSPAEEVLLRKIQSLATEETICVANPGTSLGTLKPLIRDACLLICNDTGPRHFGNAFRVPTVCIFGPTHQEWTDTGNTREIKLQQPVPCGPCQLKECPLDLRCMKEMTPTVVFEACQRMLSLPVLC